MWPASVLWPHPGNPAPCSSIARSRVGNYHSPRSQLFSLLTLMPPPSIAIVMALLLAEEKVLVHSADAASASNVAIALRTLLFPLRWELLFLPIVPVNMLGFLGEVLPFQSIAAFSQAVHGPGTDACSAAPVCGVA